MDILAKRHQGVLEAFARSNVLLAFDYDGTLAPIVAAPERAPLRAATRRLLTRVAECYPCVVISGRSLDDLTGRLHGIPLWYLFGNHGIEPMAARADHVAITRAWARQLLPLEGHRGVFIEDKRYSLTIHYRQARNKTRALSLITEALQQLSDVRVLAGHCAFSLLPKNGAHKGTALEGARRLFACDAAVYVGDDETDEDAFKSSAADRLLAVRVGTVRGSHAKYCLKSQRHIDVFLRRLLRLRRPAGQS